MSLLTRLSGAALTAAAAVSMCAFTPAGVAAASPIDDLIAALSAGSSGPQAPPSGNKTAKIVFGNLDRESAFVTTDGANPCLELAAISPAYAEQYGFDSYMQGFLSGRAKSAPPCTGSAVVYYTVRDRDKRPWGAFVVGYDSSGVTLIDCRPSPRPPAGLDQLRCNRDGEGIQFRP